ncbi:unnamed protein product, partial [Brenthis ino]
MNILLNFYPLTVLAIFSSFYIFVLSIHFPYVYPRIKLEAKSKGDAGEPLILTPYIEKGNIEQGQNLSRVSITEKIGITSHAGFLTVDSKYNSNLYFWYFPTFDKNRNAPVVLWLQGGPGGSSLFGLFTENGPLMVKKSGFVTRKYHWALRYNLLFIDNPVGTGFSFTNDDIGYCEDEQCVSKGLYNALQQFFKLFPRLQSNDFYITGESYAGKYIPSLAMEIHKDNVISKQKINLKGMALGNAYCDPVTQMDYDATDMDMYINLLNNDQIRRSVHVGGLPFHSGKEVEIHLAYDILKSVASYVAELLSHYRLLFYNGQLDIIVAYPLTENFLWSLNFSSANEYKKASRKIWKVQNDLAGYVKKAGNLTEVMVRNAGHMVPHDQPKWAYDLITKFISNKL